MTDGRFFRGTCSEILLATALGGISGCADHPGGGGGGMPSQPHYQINQIRADLTDGSTNVGQGPFKVVYSSGFIIDDSTLNRLSSRLSLRTWPEGELVATDVTNGPITDLNAPVSGTQAVVEIGPRSALDDRWYSLQFGPAEKDIFASQSFDAGVLGIRLRPGSHPAVRLIDFCEANVPGTKFIVYLSEPVAATTPAEMFTITQGGALMSCRFDDFRPTELHEFCSSLAAGPLTVTLAEGQAQGAGGAPLAPGTWSLDPSKLPIVESGCVGYRVPL